MKNSKDAGMPTRKNPVRGFYDGFVSPFRAAGFIRAHKKLYKFIVIPFLINLGTFVLVVGLGAKFFEEQVMTRLPQWQGIWGVLLNYFVVTIAVVLTLGLIFFTFTAVGCLIASPFNDLLSECTENLLVGGNNDGERFSIFALGRDMAQTMWIEFKKIALFLLGMLLLMLLHLIPGLGSMIYAPLSVAWTIFFLIMEYTGYVFTRRKMGVKEQARTIFRHFGVMCGFGTGVFLLLAVPFVQFFCMPLAVVAAVRLLDATGELADK